MNVSNSMPVGPIGQHPINRIEDGAAESSQPQSTVAQPGQPPTAKSGAAIAAQLVQDARTAKTAGNVPSIAAPLGDLVNAVTSQLGVENLPGEHRQSLVAQLADDPVVKSLIRGN